jgi:hypothetical protein
MTAGFPLPLAVAQVWIGRCFAHPAVGRTGTGPTPRSCSIVIAVGFGTGLVFIDIPLSTETLQPVVEYLLSELDHSTDPLD